MKTIELETNNGNIIHFEIADQITSSGGRRGGGQVAGVGKVKETIKQLKDVGEAIADVCRTVQDQIQVALDKSKPSELTLEFSVTLAGETGIPLVTKGTAEGTFQVTAKWDFKKE
jgi:hypothetical protein